MPAAVQALLHALADAVDLLKASADYRSLVLVDAVRRRFAMRASPFPTGLFVEAFRIVVGKPILNVFVIGVLGIAEDFELSIKTRDAAEILAVLRARRRCSADRRSLDRRREVWSG